MLVSAKAMLQSAEKGHYGIGAFNTNNLEWASAILEAAEKTQSPMISAQVVQQSGRPATALLPISFVILLKT